MKASWERLQRARYVSSVHYSPVSLRRCNFSSKIVLHCARLIRRRNFFLLFCFVLCLVEEFFDKLH